jgi:hypothetical protein
MTKFKLKVFQSRVERFFPQLHANGGTNSMPILWVALASSAGSVTE